MFSNDGKLLRAKLSCTFLQFLSGSDIGAIKNNSSPDLTHLKVTKWGDTLPLMCDDVYGDPKYYMQVAKVNDLVSIYQLEHGRQLVFPPLER